ncbi:MAG: penicillin-binding protein activator, partial [Gammaproteobacteria bacterium]|nr:penicillin-binding protein activator [Gammaproteobacteria bacterium]
MSRRLASARLLIPALLLSACVSAPPPAPTEPVAVQQARQLQATGNFAEAAELWQSAALVAVGPDRQIFRLRAAEAWLLAGEQGKSNTQLMLVEEAQLGQAEMSRFALLHAELALLDADAQRAEFYLEAASQGLAASQAERYQNASGRLLRLQTNPASFAMTTVASALNRMGPYSTVAGVALLQLMEDIPSSLLEQVSSNEAQSSSLRHWPELALSVRRSLVYGRKISEAAREWTEAHPGHAVDEAAYQHLSEAYRSLFALPANIAVLLPFEGGLAAAGKAIRDGLVSAFMSEPGSTKLRFYATEDQPESAVSAYFSAIADGSDWIIGPLRRESVSALAALGGLGVPALMLNTVEDQQRGNRDMGLVFQMSLSQELEAKAVAEYAIASDWRSALVLTADTVWGRRMKTAFEDAFNQAGGSIAADAAFSTLESDHSML